MYGEGERRCSQDKKSGVCGWTPQPVAAKTGLVLLTILCRKRMCLPLTPHTPQPCAHRPLPFWVSATQKLDFFLSSRVVEKLKKKVVDIIYQDGLVEKFYLIQSSMFFLIKTVSAGIISKAAAGRVGLVSETVRPERLERLAHDTLAGLDSLRFSSSSAAAAGGEDAGRDAGARELVEEVRRKVDKLVRSPRFPQNGGSFSRPYF